MVGDAGATIVFTTHDDRQARRAVGTPGELGPAVVALLVSAAPSVQPAPARPDSAPPASPTPGEVLPPPAAEASSSAHLDIAGSVGARVAGPGSFVSPDVGILASLTLSHWEIGVLAQWDPAQSPLQASAPAGFAMSTFDVGVLMGRRQPVGGIELLGGVMAAVSVTSEQGADTGGSGATGGPSSAEPRVGAYAGVVFPRRSRLRVRSMLGADLAASRIGRMLVKLRAGNLAGYVDQSASPLGRRRHVNATRSGALPRAACGAPVSYSPGPARAPPSHRAPFGGAHP